MATVFTVWAIVTVLNVGLPAGRALNIRQIIEQRPELSSLKEFAKNLPFLKDVGVDRFIKYTFFAPHNDAFLQLPPNKELSYKTASTSTQKQMEIIMRFHTIDSTESAKVMTADFGDTVHPSTAPGTPNLFLRTVDGEYYVNGARVLQGDIEASNGVIHIIDSLMYDISETKNVLEYLNYRPKDTRMQTSKFYSLLLEYNSQQNGGNPTAYWQLNGGKKVTLFVPSDDALSRIPTQQYTALLNDVAQLKQVVEGHVIKDNAYHLNLLTRPSYIQHGIEAMDGRVMPKHYSGDVYVSNNCAQGKVIFGNITVRNGVVHITDGLLGFVYSDALQLFKGDRDLHMMYGHILSSQSISDMLRVDVGGTVSDNNKLTIFAPVDPSMRGVDYTQNERNLLKMIYMHILRGEMALSDMGNGTQRPTLNNGSVATFYRLENEVYVEVNYVRAKITQGDICVKNGIVHKVDHVLGVPKYTANELIEDDEKFLELYRACRETGLTQYLGDTTKKITVFAPVDSAFYAMQDTENGRKLLDHRHTENLKRVINRHIIPSELFLDQLPDGRTERTAVLGSVIEIDKQGSTYSIRFEGHTVRVTRANMRIKNGVFHVVDRVMYSTDPRALEWTSAADTTAPPVGIIILLVALFCGLL